MSYDSGAHTVFYHRYHIVWITKYRYKVVSGELLSPLTKTCRSFRFAGRDDGQSPDGRNSSADSDSRGSRRRRATVSR